MRVDSSKPVEFVGVFYTQHGQVDGEKNDRPTPRTVFGITLRFLGQGKSAVTFIFLPWTNRSGFTRAFVTSSRSLFPEGYYYGSYTANSFNLSSLMKTVSSAELKKAGVVSTLKPSLLIEDFKGDWKKEWFTYKVDKWGIKTHKPYSRFGLPRRTAGFVSRSGPKWRTS